LQTAGIETVRHGRHDGSPTGGFDRRGLKEFAGLRPKGKDLIYTGKVGTDRTLSTKMAWERKVPTGVEFDGKL
jgi:hypothetical protein